MRQCCVSTLLKSVDVHNVIERIAAEMESIKSGGDSLKGNMIEQTKKMFSIKRARHK